MVIGCEFESHSWQVVLNTTLCDKSLIGLWFSRGIAIFSNNKTDRHYMTEIFFESGIKRHNPNPYIIVGL
jgi:hypothetical protein